MARGFIILTLSFALTACNNSGTVTNENNVAPALANKPDTVETTLKKSNDSSNAMPDSIVEPGINYEDLENIHYSWSESSTDKYILKKGFKFYSDTIFPETKTFVFGKSEPSAILEISRSNYSEGAISFSINYYTTSKIEYENFIKSLSTSKYKYNKRNKRYEIFMGTYEDLCIYTNGQILKNKEMYYWVKYLHYQGKELSVPGIEE